MVKHYTANPPDYMQAIKDKKEFYIQFHQFARDVESVIIRIVHRYLEEYDILFMKNPILTVVKELLNNAVKANIKRLYFKNKNLEIDKIDEYRKGMETFKTEVYQKDNSAFLDKLEKSNLVVRISFKTSKEHIHINVINNIPILDQELKKVRARIVKAYKYDDITDAFDDVIDDSEGAGLGLIMAMMLFKNAGLPADSFQIYRKDELTIATLSIPQGMTKTESQKKIASEIITEVDNLPAFPDNIRRIQELCKNPDVEIREISMAISMDAGLASSILKLANSAGYVTSKMVDTIEEAVMIIGIKGINTLLVATGVTDIIKSKYKRYEAIFKDSYKRAFYAQKLSLQINKTKLTDYAYLAGLLADLGRIIMLSISSEQMIKLKKIAGFKGIDDPNLLEEMSIGLSHSTLGSMIAAKWNFHDALIKAIEYHQRPFMAPESEKVLVYLIYLADIFVNIENKKSRYDIVDEDVLNYFKLTDEKSFSTLHNILRKSYEQK
jgi:HD-like signal output (HDOD) protein